VKDQIFKQYSLPWLGTIKELMVNTLFWISVLNFVMLSITTYNTSFLWLRAYIPFMSVPAFFLGLVVLVVIPMGIIEYKFIMSSYGMRSMNERLPNIEAVLKIKEGKEEVKKGGS
jgi:hypothetical protein